MGSVRPGSLLHLAILGQLVEQTIGRAPRMRHPAVTVGQRAAGTVGQAAADEDRRMRLLHRLRPRHHRPELDELAVYSGFVLVQIARMASMRSRMTLLRLLKSVPWSAISSAFQPAPDAEQEPALGDLVDAGDRLGRLDRIALRHEADAGRDLEPRGDGGRAPSTTNGSITS